MPQLYVISPQLEDDDAAFDKVLQGLLAEAAPAAVLLRLSPVRLQDERAAIKTLKRWAQPLQDAGVAVLAEVSPAIALRSGLDGLHKPATSIADRQEVESCKPKLMVGCGQIRLRHEAMTAGEQGVDYVMFGEPRADGYVPPLDQTLDLTEWWAGLFELPCVAYAQSLHDALHLKHTGCEFIALGKALWQQPDDLGKIMGSLREVFET